MEWYSINRMQSPDNHVLKKYATAL
jgi:hypothetical protein